MTEKERLVKFQEWCDRQIRLYFELQPECYRKNEGAKLWITRILVGKKIGEMPIDIIYSGEGRCTYPDGEVIVTPPSTDALLGNGTLLPIEVKEEDGEIVSVEIIGDNYKKNESKVMTKEEKLQKVLKKWAASYKDDKNRIITDSYCNGDLIKSECAYIDIYSTIIYKHKPDWLESDYQVIVGYSGDNPDSKILVLRNSVGVAFITPFPIDGFDDVKRVSIEDIPEEMLDEMLAVKDFGPIITIKVPDPTPKEKSQPKYRSKIIKYLPAIISGVAIVVSLIAIFVC